MVARDRFKYRFKISELRLNLLFFVEKAEEMNFNEDFNIVECLKHRFGL